MRRGLVWSLIFIVVLAAGTLAATIGTGHTPLLGLDLKGGVSVVLRPQVTAGGSQLNEAVAIIERRVNGLGVSNSNVAVQGQDVVINLPGIKNSQQALNELGTTAQLLFRPVLCTVPGYTPPSATSSTTVPAPAAVTQTDCNNTNVAQMPSTPVSQDNATSTVLLPVDPKAFPTTPTDRYILGPADLTGTAVSDASSQLDQTTGQYDVNLTLNSKGAVGFDKIASARYVQYQTNPNSPPNSSLEAFELDGTVESAPTFQAASFNGSVQITGSFTSSQASALANQLKYGSLPVRFVPQSVQTVSATIGKDSLRAGLLAGIGGLLVVMLYMIVYYRALGLVVLAGLGVGGAILYAILSELSQTSGLTLTLAGVTGIIVSIGITVDSYVVYFERLKDEVRGGRSVRQSVERGFTRAFKTVLTADLVSFLAALILYILTIGDVRGFAFTLGLSTLLDVFTAYFFIRPAVILVGRRRSLTDNRFFGISRGLGARAVPREA